MTDSLDVDLPETLDLVSQSVDFAEMEQDIARFASEPSVKTVLEVGIDLQNYSSQIAKELEEVEALSIDDYLRQATRVEKLQSEIRTCDSALEAMEDLLIQFKESLGQLSDDICYLQTKSQEISVKLTNRKTLEKILSEFTKEVTVRKDLADRIISGEVNPAYIKALEELHRKLEFIDKPEVKKTPSVMETKVTLGKMCQIAVEYVKKWLSERCDELRSKSSDRLSIQNSMLRSRYAMTFLNAHSQQTLSSCKQLYIETLSRVYLDQFKSLTKQASKKMAIRTTVETLVPTSQKSFLRKKQFGNTSVLFSLGERAKLLSDVLGPSVDFPEGSFPVESLLRSLYQTLIDTVTSEHAFSSGFFRDDNVSASIFNATCSHLENFLRDLLSKISDPITLLLLKKFNEIQKSEMERRRVFKIDSHLTTVHSLIEARFSEVLNQNIMAVENAKPAVFLENQQTSHHANALTRRFTEFVTSMVYIEGLETPDVHRVSASVLDLLERVSKEFPTEEISQVFLINNFYLITSKLPEGNLIELFGQKLNESTIIYVDLVLLSNFRKLVETVRKAYVKLESREEPIQTELSERELKEIAEGFGETHLEKMKAIQEAQMVRFGDFENGREILRMIAKRLVLYWAKFEQLVRVSVGQKGGWTNSILSTQQLVLNIRPITESF